MQDAHLAEQMDFPESVIVAVNLASMIVAVWKKQAMLEQVSPWLVGDVGRLCIELDRESHIVAVAGSREWVVKAQIAKLFTGVQGKKMLPLKLCSIQSVSGVRPLPQQRRLMSRSIAV